MVASKFYNRVVLAALLVLFGCEVVSAMETSDASVASVSGVRAPGAAPIPIPGAGRSGARRRGRGGKKKSLLMRLVGGSGALGEGCAAPADLAGEKPSFCASFASASSESAPVSARVAAEAAMRSFSVSPVVDRSDGASSPENVPAGGSAPATSSLKGLGAMLLSSAVVPFNGGGAGGGFAVARRDMDALVGEVADAVVRRIRSRSVSSGSSSGSESDGDIDWETHPDEVRSASDKVFKGIKIFHGICQRESSSFMLLRNPKYCLLVGADSKGPDAPGVPAPCLQVLCVLRPELAKKSDCEYWAHHAASDPDAFNYSNMFAFALEFLGKKLRVLSASSSRSERENGGPDTATIHSPHRQFWSTQLSPKATSEFSGAELRRVELDEACLLLNSARWNALFRMLVKKMWVKGNGVAQGHSRPAEKCWDYLMEKNSDFCSLVEEWNMNYDRYFSSDVSADASLSFLCALFPQRKGWNAEKPFWLKTERWL
jgi:hypothetical protein